MGMAFGVDKSGKKPAVITKISKDGIATQSGRLSIGMIISAINGKRTQGLSKPQVAELVNESETLKLEVVELKQQTSSLLHENKSEKEVHGTASAFTKSEGKIVAAKFANIRPALVDSNSPTAADAAGDTGQTAMSSSDPASLQVPEGHQTLTPPTKLTSGLLRCTPLAIPPDLPRSMLMLGVVLVTQGSYAVSVLSLPQMICTQMSARTVLHRATTTILRRERTSAASLQSPPEILESQTPIMSPRAMGSSKQARKQRIISSITKILRRQAP